MVARSCLLGLSALGFALAGPVGRQRGFQWTRRGIDGPQDDRRVLAPRHVGSPLPDGPGIFLTPMKLTIISVAVVVLLGLAFFLGLMVGRS